MEFSKLSPELHTLCTIMPFMAETCTIVHLHSLTSEGVLAGLGKCIRLFRPANPISRNSDSRSCGSEKSTVLRSMTLLSVRVSEGAHSFSSNLENQTDPLRLGSRSPKRSTSPSARCSHRSTGPDGNADPERLRIISMCVAREEMGPRGRPVHRTPYGVFVFGKMPPAPARKYHATVYSLGENRAVD